MDFVFEFIFELILDLLFEGSMDTVKNKRISKWVRYPLAILLILICLAVLGLIGLAGYLLIKQGETSQLVFGIFLFGLDIFIAVAAVRIIRQIRREQRETPEPDPETSSSEENPFEQ